MEQNFNSNQNDFLWTLLANPAEDARPYLYNLQRLVNDYPQSGILQALLVHASEDKNLRRASTCLNPSSVYKLINMPSSLVGVPDERIFVGSEAREIKDVAPSIHAESHHDYNGNSVLSDANPAEIAPVEALSDSQYEIAALPGAADDTDDLLIPEIPVGEDIPVPVISETATEPEAEIASEIADGTQPYITEIAADYESMAAPTDITSGDADVGETTAGNTDMLPPDMPPLPEHPAQEPPPLPADPLPYARQHEEIIAETAWDNLVAGTAQANKQRDDNETYAIDEQQPGHAGEAEMQPATPVEVLAEVPQNPAPAADETLVTAHNQAEEPVQHGAGVIDHAADIEEDTGASNKINDEVYDEIVAIDQINIKPLASAPPAPGVSATKERKPDFFTFEEMYGERKNTAEESEESAGREKAAITHGEKAGEQVQQDVSMYNDEKLPYSFLWWLDKTRKEHAGIYQPYVHAAVPASDVKTKKSTDELQQQYFENIFHITSIEELERSTSNIPAASVDNRRREQMIIEKFIKEEPQIRPQSSDKLDNENKAKKSSEDRDELVSETLAAIYSDQMLYHKAISSYKKLMLKFPQKSVYFAGKIEQLEKKIN